jgi:hypothetical protein
MLQFCSAAVPLFAIFDERMSASEQIDEFVIVGMPMAQAQPSAWRQVHEFHTDISRTVGIIRRCRPRSTRSASNGAGWYEPVGCGKAAMVALGHDSTR